MNAQTVFFICKAEQQVQEFSFEEMDPVQWCTMKQLTKNYLTCHGIAASLFLMRKWIWKTYI